MNSQMVPTTFDTSNGTASVTWDGGLQLGSTTLGWHDVATTWWPTYHTYPRPNPTEIAFKIVGKLVEDGIVEGMTVKKFVKLVDDVAKIVKDS